VFFCKKWTFPQCRVHYVQYQYFLFYILLIWGGCVRIQRTPLPTGLVSVAVKTSCNETKTNTKTSKWDIQRICIAVNGTVVLYFDQIIWRKRDWIYRNLNSSIKYLCRLCSLPTSRSWKKWSLQNCSLCYWLISLSLQKNYYFLQRTHC